MEVSVSVAVMVCHLPDLVEYSTTITAPQRCQTLNYFRVYWRGGHIRYPVAVGRRADDVAHLRRHLPRLLRRGRRAAAARHGDTARLLRNPGAALRGTGPHTADDPAGRGRFGEQEPGLARGGPPGGARLDPPPGLPDRPARPARGAHRRGIRGPGGGGSRPRRARPPDAAGPAHPRAGPPGAGDQR